MCGRLAENLDSPLPRKKKQQARGDKLLEGAEGLR
jgi:hypothetical protein